MSAPSPAPIGHGAVLDRLRAAAAADRLPHALLFSGPEGVGKRTTALAFARELIASDDPAEADRFDRGAHERFLLYSDLEKPLPVRRADLLAGETDESDLLAVYGILEAEGWITGARAAASGPGRIDLLERNLEKFVGRRGVPFADVLERELASLNRSKKSTPASVEIARRLFSPGTSRAFYRRSLGIDLVTGRGDGEYFRNVSALLGTASGGEWRVAIFDDAHKMTDAAENAFLKTLEEPPSGTLIVLVTSEPLSLLPTTLSRCARVVFDAVPEAELERFLVDTQGVEPDEARLLVALAGGSVGDALRLRGLDLEERRRFVVEMLPALADGDLARALALAGARFATAAAGDGPSGPRSEARLLLEMLALALRDLVVAGAIGRARLLSGLDEPAARELATRLPPEAWERLFERTEVALADVAANVEPRLAVEALLAEALPRVGAA